MAPNDPSQDRSRHEWLAVAVLTLIGAALRFWPIGGVGLTHFDEGIYALVASGQMPLVDLMAYAPPGFTILGGLAFAVLGPSDSALILVSQIAGTLTIPVIAWLGRRTFGPGAGFASSVFCAFSGPQIAFSRMALTDASFLLAWLLALGAGMRFLERPGFVRALVMGLAVGLAQEFKYNGWLTGGIVIGSALVGIVVRPEERKLGSIAKIFGWGGFAGVVAWLVVWPWFAYVESHGGYSALLRHQQSYLGGFGAWWPNLLSQADQAVALSGGIGLIGPAVVLAMLTPWIARPTSWPAITSRIGPSRRFLVAAIFAVIAGFLADAPYELGLLALPWLLTRPAASARILGVSWLTLGATSPFYHPYARLWLPFEAGNWILIGCLVAEGPALARVYDFSTISGSWKRLRFNLGVVCLLGLAGMGTWIAVTSKVTRSSRAQPDLLDRSDSLRQASDHASLLLPDDVKGLQVLARPPVIYYLSGRVRLYRMASSAALSKRGDPNVWALVDSWNLRSELGQGTEESSRNLLDRFANHWEVVQEFPTILSLPTLLDINPDAARGRSADRNCSLWLLRPRRAGVKR